MHFMLDKWMMLLILLLVTTLSSFVLGFFPYPVGMIVLMIAIIARYLVLKNR